MIQSHVYVNDHNSWWHIKQQNDINQTWCILIFIISSVSSTLFLSLFQSLLLNTAEIWTHGMPHTCPLFSFDPQSGLTLLQDLQRDGDVKDRVLLQSTDALADMMAGREHIVSKTEEVMFLFKERFHVSCSNMFHSLFFLLILCASLGNMTILCSTALFCLSHTKCQFFVPLKHLASWWMCCDLLGMVYVVYIACSYTVYSS